VQKLLRCIGIFSIFDSDACARYVGNNDDKNTVYSKQKLRIQKIPTPKAIHSATRQDCEQSYITLAY